MNNNRGRRGGNDFDRNRMQGGQQRDFYNQNRFGPPGMNGPAGMNMRGGNMQNFGPRNNFMWQPRSGLCLFHQHLFTHFSLLHQIRYHFLI